MGPKKKGGKGKGKKGKTKDVPQGPTPAELLAQIAVLNIAKDKETQERNLMMLERVRNSLLFIPSFFPKSLEQQSWKTVFHCEISYLRIVSCRIQFCSMNREYTVYVVVRKAG